MKAFVIAAALAWSGTAIAQVSPPVDTPEATPDQAAPPDMSMPPDMTTLGAPPDSTMPPSDPAAPMPAPTDTMPPPANPDAMPMGTTDEMATPAPSTKDYPKCTRKLRDNCINPGGR